MAGLSGRRRRTQEDVPAAIARLEEKHRQMHGATEEWLQLLREMERNGESSQARYETYYQAYVQAREQEKRVDLELFNLRQGLVG